MSKEERIEILNKLNTQLDGVDAYLRQLEEGEDDKHWHCIVSAQGTLSLMREFLEWYEAEAKERD